MAQAHKIMSTFISHHFQGLPLSVVWEMLQGSRSDESPILHPMYEDGDFLPLFEAEDDGFLPDYN
jgi:hypothetical protein